MPAVYRIRFRLAAPLATPLHSGTLFGNLCWIWRYLYGEENLAKWLVTLYDDPFLISDAFPAGHLPRPLLRPSAPRALTLQEVNLRKRVKKVRFVPRKIFSELRDRMSEDNLQASLVRCLAEEESAEGRRTPEENRRHGTESWVRVPHNRIHRLTGRTPEIGGLFFTEELWASGLKQYKDVYVYTSLALAKLQELFEQMGKLGYGKDASWGRGRFDGIEIEPDQELSADTSRPRAISLSHGSLTPNMRNTKYHLETHYGRVGGVYSCTESPFKYPLILLKPGATFDAGSGPFGELLTDVHPNMPWVRHNAWHLIVTFREAD